ncbi:MAG: redoxin domain-containing protein [Fimbriimonas sp.]
MAFDSGMRSKPWRMEGLGDTPFQITCKTPEVQMWFDQGHALLQSFWFEEAERSFRWCLKLDPECAMAYWGLARCGYNWFAAMGKVADDPKDRYRAFLKQASSRKDTVSERERLYIEAWEKAFAVGVERPSTILEAELCKIVVKYPADVEAKALLAFHSIGASPGSRYSTQLVVNQVLAQNPLHPGAHHASIHNWDGGDATQALLSCQMYGKSAPGVGHALHMPGHCYTKMGMWHEAAWSMDAATRTELKYMNDRLALPFETWNYQHNRNYLCYIQEQLGMAEASIQGARDLLNAPTDPEQDNVNGGGFTGQGLSALTRAYIKFERWDDILRPGSIAWPPGEQADFSRLYTEAIAFAGKGDAKQARGRLNELKSVVAKESEKNKMMAEYVALPVASAEGLVLLAEGKTLEGLHALGVAAAKEKEQREKDEYGSDPPDMPWPVMRLIGDAYLKRGDGRLAIEAYENALKAEPNDGFTLAGLAKAHASLGEKDVARNYAGRLAYVWSAADPGSRWLKEVAALNIDAAPIGEVPAAERIYRPAELASYGPSNWAPFAAPELDCLDVKGQKVSLSQFKGKNVLLIFFLNEACVHCVEQLGKVNEKLSDFEKANTVVLAVSSASPAMNKASVKLTDFGIRLLSDKDHANARRFASYDDFEDLELHSTILIDGSGKVRWKRTGGDPFSNVDFLLRELARVNGKK